MASYNCLQCKGGRNLCGKGYCPLLQDMKARLPKVEVRSKEVYGRSPPAVFVGRYGYPKVSVGPLVPMKEPEDPGLLNRPADWRRMDIQDIVIMRSSLLRSKEARYVKEARLPKGVLETSQELAMSDRATYTEVQLEKAPPEPFSRFDPFSAPMGPSANALKAELAENTHVPRKVDYLVGDTDVKAVDAILELYGHRTEGEQIKGLLSMGLLGRERARKMVPTRWSITATDDILGKDMINRVKDLQQLGEYRVHTYSHLGNIFQVVLIPDIWGFEMCETWLRGAFWAPRTAAISDHEGYYGRKQYAFNVSGAYYAARLGALEHLLRIGRQAEVLINREITPDYWAPLGVWVIREGVRRAMRRAPRTFDTLKEALAYTKEGANVKEWWKKSHNLRERRLQSRLTDF